jgi:prepilin-type N-terminal cleavage/methylation domain-containing protein
MMRARRERARAGFTLVEIMIAVLIIGILLAIAVPQFQAAGKRARATACQRTLKEILGAKERWAMDTNQGPSAVPTLTDLVVPGVYLRSTPRCPEGGTYTIGSMDQLPRCELEDASLGPLNHGIQ